jgi:hypothetical protein
LDPGGIDDWIVPAPAPSQTEHPDDWFVPGNARTDSSYPNDWINPGSNAPAAVAPSAAPLAPSQQPSVAAGLSNRPLPPPNPLAAYWSLIPASHAGATAWQQPIFLPPNPFSHENIPASAWVTPPPIFLNSPQPFPSISPAPPANPPSAAAEGLLGGIPKMLAASASSDFLHDSAGQGLLGGIPKLLAASASLDPFWTPGSWGLLGALAGLQPAPSSAQADTTFTPDLRPFLSSDPMQFGLPLGYLRDDWPNRPDPTANDPDRGTADEVSDLRPSTDQQSLHPNVLLVGDEDEEEKERHSKIDPTEFGGITDKGLGSSPKELPHLPMLLPLFPRGAPPPTSAPQPAPRPSLPPPVSTLPGALPPPSPGPTGNSPRPIGPPIGPARVPASPETSEGEASNRGGADPAARGRAA